MTLIKRDNSGSVRLWTPYFDSVNGKIQQLSSDYIEIYLWCAYITSSQERLWSPISENLISS